MKNLPVRMARWSAVHPWRGIVGWFVFVVLCLALGISVGTNAATTEDFRIGEAGRGEAIAAEGGLQQRPVEHVLITAKPGTGKLDIAAADSAAADVAALMRKLPEVLTVTDPVRAADNTAVRVTVTMKGEAGGQGARRPAARADRGRTEGQPRAARRGDRIAFHQQGSRQAAR